MMREKELTQKRLKELLKYDPETKIWTWIKIHSKKMKINDIAGYIRKNRDYREITIDYKSYQESRLACLYMEGYLPECKIGRKKENVPSEEWEQKQIFIWAKGHQIEIPELKWLNGSINGFRLTPKLILKTKAQGVRKGYPDINLPVRTNKYTGLYIELKRIKGGKLSPDQKEWKEHLNSQGYLCLTCEGHKEAILVIKNYL